MTTITPLLRIKERIKGPSGLFNLQNEWYGYADEFKYTIGLAGLMGFGVGCCRPELLPENMAPLPGCDDRFSPNYGNYIHLPSASIMCFLPAHHIELKAAATTAPFFGTEVIITDGQSGNSVLARPFRDAGLELAGIFVDKYPCCNVKPDGSGEPNHSDGLPGGSPLTNGIAASRPLQWPLTFGRTGNFDAGAGRSPTQNLSSKALNPNAITPSIDLFGVFNAARTRGPEFNVTPSWVRAQIAYLSLAHTQALLGTNGLPVAGATDNAAWMDVAPYTPKGNNNNNGADFNKISLVFGRTDIPGTSVTSLGFPGTNYRAFTGAARIVNVPAVEHTTHNGQLSGIVDVNGNQPDACPGINTDSPGTTTAGTAQYKIWPEAKSWNLCTQQADILNFGDLINPSSVWWNSSLTPFINIVPISNTYASSTDSNPDLIKFSENLIPRISTALANAQTSTNIYGGDQFTRQVLSDCIFLFGGSYSTLASAGIFNVQTNVITTGFKNITNFSGFRAMRLLAP